MTIAPEVIAAFEHDQERRDAKQARRWANREAWLAGTNEAKSRRLTIELDEATYETLRCESRERGERTKALARQAIVEWLMQALS